VGAARAVLRGGGSAVEAAVAAVVVLEDDERFNAGRGSVLTAMGEVEADAAVMDGARRRAGAVAALRAVANPVLAARGVLEEGEHVLLCGEGAQAAARRAGLPAVGPERLVTPERLAQHREREAAVGPAELATVGAVVRDAAGHLAAATSTGGVSGQASGRIGDSPIVGAGTYADDRSCAVSATGRGEAILEAVLAHEVAALVAHRGLDAQRAAERALREVRGHAALIVVDREGRAGLAGAPGAFARALAGLDGEVSIALDADEAL
jgi:beta-aspartyl-peptidase (threonine type)